jgi:hypothetical protein
MMHDKKMRIIHHFDLYPNIIQASGNAAGDRLQTAVSIAGWRHCLVSTGHTCTESDAAG